MKTAREVHIILRSLQRGGIERCRLRMARRCRDWGIPVKILLVENRGALCEEVPSDIPLVHVGRLGKWLFPVLLLRHLYREKPAVIWSAADDIHIVTLLIARMASRRTRVLVSKHNTFSLEYSRVRGLGACRRELLRWGWRRLLVKADSIVCVSFGVADDLASATGVPKRQLSVVYNPVYEPNVGIEGTETPQKAETSGRTIGYVGRLVRFKNVPLLVRAVARLRERFPDVRLLVAGDGPERSSVTSEVEKEGLDDCVEFLGEVADPQRIMRLSDVVVLSSDREGLGNVLIEAMGCGTQVVSTDCPHGPAEILDNGVYGQLVPVGDVEALARAMERVLTGEAYVDPERLRKRASDFSVDAATRRYLELSGWPVLADENGAPETGAHADPARREGDSM